MPPVSKEKLLALQSRTECIRNICIMAHVDHGKTTLADYLLASNGIISQRLAGKLRFMDSRKDEQERGITMKSSAISLYHNSMSHGREYLINLIDSPGHVDFSSEVSTAIRLCDGVLILVDVVEGVCAQTIVSLRLAWEENLKPVLVLNKIDRLILEVKMAPLDAYLHLTQILEKLNAVTAELFTSNVLGKESTTTDVTCEDGLQELYDWNTGLEDADDSNIYFSPDQGNVVFTSASDGWGFRLEDFAEIYSCKLGFSKTVLKKTLWGDFYINTKLKRIMKGAQEKAKKPLFVQLILGNIWTVYDTVVVRKDKSAIQGIVANLNLSVQPRDLRQTDFKSILYSIMSSWLPLSNAILEMVCLHLPSPLELTESKVERLMQMQSKDFSALPVESQNLKTNFLQCVSGEDVPVIIFVSKLFPTDTKSLPEKKPKPLSHEEIAARREQVKLRILDRKNQTATGTDSSVLPLESNEISTTILSRVEESPKDNVEDDVTFIAFGRVYSGTVKKGCRYFVIGPKHDPGVALQSFRTGESIPYGLNLKDLKPGQHVTEVEINQLYLLMGSELETLDSVPAGCIFGIGGLEEHILKTATISSTIACPPFIDVTFLVDPILRVAIEPKYTCDMAALRLGLKLLNQADPCVQVFVQETGEHVIVTAGEVHLQRCLDDLREGYAKIELTASAPIVPFRETIVTPPKVDMVNEAIHPQQTKQYKNYSDSFSSSLPIDDSELIIQQTANKRSIIKLHALPLPIEVVNIIETHSDLLKDMKRNETVDILKTATFMTKLRENFEAAGWNGNSVGKIWSFGPQHTGPNILFNNVKTNTSACIWPGELRNPNTSSTELLPTSSPLFAYGSNFVNGFQLVTSAGPLCEEPLRGVAFSVEEWTCEQYEAELNVNQPFGPFSGQIMSAVKEACRKAFQAQPQRLMLAMYSCNIQVNSEVLGRLYAVLGKRGGQILHGDLQEGSSMFEVTAQLPVIESFDFANEVRRHTSGLALPQLVFSHWEVLDIDPFWQPTTEEEYLHFGEKADTENRARKYMNAIRKRKGLYLEEKIVEFGEKQRTLSKKK